jgi:hypothetical protein
MERQVEGAKGKRNRKARKRALTVVKAQVSLSEIVGGAFDVGRIDAAKFRGSCVRRRF